MGIVFPYREKIALAQTVLTLSPVPGRSFKVTGVSILTSQAEDWATLRSGLSSVGFFSVGDADHNHLPLFPDITSPESLLHFLETSEFVTGYPVVEGDPFQVKLANAADLIKLEYEEYDAEDMTADMPNGKASDQLLILLYGTNSAAVTAAGYVSIDKCLNPKEFSNFPYESVMPTGRSFRIHSILCLDVSDNDYPGTTDKIHNTKFCRLTKNREVLYNSDMDGFYVAGTGAAAGSANTVINKGTNQLPYIGNDKAGGFFLLPDDLVCGPGDELNIEVSLDGDFGTLAAETLRVCLAGTMMKVAA